MMTMMVRGLGGRRPVTLTSPLPLPQALRGNKHNKECLSNKHNNESKTIHKAMFIKPVRWAPGPTLLLENKKVPRNFNWGVEIVEMGRATNAAVTLFSPVYSCFLCNDIILHPEDTYTPLQLLLEPPKTEKDNNAGGRRGWALGWRPLRLHFLWEAPMAKEEPRRCTTI